MTAQTFSEESVDLSTATRLLAEAEAEAQAPVSVQAPAVIIDAQPDCEVDLVAGIVNVLDGTSETSAVVRELNGSDEEALASPAVLKSVAKYLGAVISRGVVTIGGKKPTQNELDALLVGDRELLLLGIRRATYGEYLELVTICPHCEDRDEKYLFPLRSVPFRRLENPQDAIYGFEMSLPSGKKAHLMLPTAADQDAVLTAEKNTGEMNTLILSRSLQKLNGEPVLSENAVRTMGLRDRTAALNALRDRTPGPKIGEAKRTCGACEKDFDLEIGLLDIFRI